MKSSKQYSAIFVKNGLSQQVNKSNILIRHASKVYQHSACTNQNEILKGDSAMAIASVPYFKSVIKLDHSNPHKNILLAF